ncbi:MAG: ABC transporter ATP-binding protein [Mesorhizobium sp.]|uniref:ABC transporter ATP-binding protein n=1 Tax=Mesorhizobium sp. TaxID=1871066 RepID=UPI000FE48D27|nr:ABC transporter ATP-binding protein [Mesorhizobium sp.]RWM71782.1 MAG: ABC transporter ATP-binding protein [Mesorhizobium sp.]RWN52218.1 MAG: ABC transporter ATP-binding protein [Mesorhizobium sp.]RWN61095.1 MAG: ABC transporter ATP-binding protein [Mesorhizobium sp.]TIO13801.1 MAG: ABC transporter ATP-binding protein [Mesorhizobium sp.]TIR30056.1 MAG: ABC transporter ATP-binding protein [Mesorhizobium sp.]
MAIINGHKLPISIANVCKRYGSVVALDNVSLDIAAGEFVTLLGPSGSGKTTLLMALAGFSRPDAGSLRFGERQVMMLAPHERGVGMVFQSYALFPHMNVLANVAFPLRIRKFSAAESARRAEAALALVDLSGYGKRQIHELSGGQQQRVALARAVVFEPPILLMDEPLSALDQNLRERMQIEIRRLHERLGMTTVYVTHDQREALTMSDRIAVLNRGRIEQYDAPADIYEHPASAFVADFIGESTLLPLAARGSEARLGEQRLILPRPASTGDHHVLVLRPEKLELLAPGTAPPPDMNVISGQVQDRVFQGDSVLIFVKPNEGPTFSFRLAAKASLRDRVPERDSEVRVCIAQEDTLVVPVGTA